MKLLRHFCVSRMQILSVNEMLNVFDCLLTAFRSHRSLPLLFCHCQMVFHLPLIRCQELQALLVEVGFGE